MSFCWVSPYVQQPVAVREEVWPVWRRGELPGLLGSSPRSDNRVQINNTHWITQLYTYTSWPALSVWLRAILSLTLPCSSGGVGRFPLTTHENSEQGEDTVASCLGHLNMFQCFRLFLGKIFHAQHFKCAVELKNLHLDASGRCGFIFPNNSFLQLAWIYSPFSQGKKKKGFLFSAPVSPPTWIDLQWMVPFNKTFGTESSMNYS